MNSPKPDPWAVWEGLASQYSDNKALVRGLYDDLEKHYCEPQRHYHNWEYVQSLLQHYEEYQDQLVKREVILFSIFYHDLIYAPARESMSIKVLSWLNEPWCNLVPLQLW